jgi:hypothetical protein
MNNISRWLGWILHIAIIATMVAAPIAVIVLLVVILILH